MPHSSDNGIGRGLTWGQIGRVAVLGLPILATCFGTLYAVRALGEEQLEIKATVASVEQKVDVHEKLPAAHPVTDARIEQIQKDMAETRGDVKKIMQVVAAICATTPNCRL